MLFLSVAVSCFVFGVGSLCRAALWCSVQVVVLRRAVSLCCFYAEGAFRGETSMCNGCEWSEREMGANILSNRPQPITRTSLACYQICRSHASDQPCMHANSPKSSGRQSASTCGKREATQNGERGKGKGNSCSRGPRAELPRADETKSRGENKIHVTSETVSPNANMGSRKELCEGRTYSSRGHGSTQVLAVELLEKVSVRMRCARPTLSSRRTWYPH